jgi:hypothetical protein
MLMVASQAAVAGCQAFSSVRLAIRNGPCSIPKG